MEERSLWKPKHPGVPRDWKQLGEGGNAYIWTDGTYAIKRLKPNASSEAVARFRREAEILASICDYTELHITAVHEIRERVGEVEIVMDKMSGSLDDVIERFAGQPEKAVHALIPIVETLAALSNRDRAIHHRDIKPSNLLFNESEDVLYLADFGCAYLSQDERLTPLRRAMGAWAFRPPEYSVGRVTEVSEKGDVFSLGKVFWAMVNGERGVGFPGPVWFEREYDLGLKFAECPQIQHTMLIVSKAVAINPDKRPSLSQFADMLRALDHSHQDETSKATSIEMLHAEAYIEVEYQQRRASTATFVRAIHSDLFNVITDLHFSNPDFQMHREWYLEAKRTPQTVEALEEQVANYESDASVVNVRFRRRILNTRFHPATEDSPAYFLASVGLEDKRNVKSKLVIRNEATGLLFEMQIQGENVMSGQYRRGVLRQFLEGATRVSLDR